MRHLWGELCSSLCASLRAQTHSYLVHTAGECKTGLLTLLPVIQYKTTTYYSGNTKHTDIYWWGIVTWSQLSICFESIVDNIFEIIIIFRFIRNKGRSFDNHSPKIEERLALIGKKLNHPVFTSLSFKGFAIDWNGYNRLVLVLDFRPDAIEPHSQISKPVARHQRCVRLAWSISCFNLTNYSR